MNGVNRLAQRTANAQDSVGLKVVEVVEVVEVMEVIKGERDVARC